MRCGSSAAAAAAATPLLLLLLLSAALAVSAQDQQPQDQQQQPLTPQAASLIATPRVVGGREASISRVKYQVGLELGGALCGGSLIRSDVVLTAAHCVSPKLPDLSTVVAVVGAQGAFYTLPLRGGGTAYGARLIKKNSKYAAASNANDVALIFLDKCVTLGPTVGIVQMATEEEMQAALTSTWIVSGYGTTSRGADSWGQGGAMAAKLQYGELKYVDPNTCQQAVGRVDPDSMVCALGLAAVGGGAPPVQDSCQGDSGGPLFFNTKAPSAPMSGAAEDDRLVGAVSWGNGCGQRGAPGVYSNIPKLSVWVNQQLAENPSLCDGPLPPAGGGGGGGSGGGNNNGNGGISSGKLELASSDRNWAGKPSLSARVPAAKADAAVDYCTSRCDARRARCNAFSVSVLPARAGSASANPRLQCDFYATVPTALCDGSAGGQFACARTSQGSYGRGVAGL